MTWRQVACFAPFALFVFCDWIMLYLRWQQERQLQQNPDKPLRHYSTVWLPCWITLLLGWLLAGAVGSVPKWVPLLVLLDFGTLEMLALFFAAVWKKLSGK